MTTCEQKITQTFSAHGSSITISINMHFPFSLARAAAGGPCCGCHCSRAHSGDVGGVGGVGGVGVSAASGHASQETSADSQLTVAGGMSAELGINEGGVGVSAASGHASQETSADSELTVAGSVSAELGTSEGVVGRDGAGGLETTADSAQIDSLETHVVSDS